MIANIPNESFDKVVELLALLGLEAEVKIVVPIFPGLGPFQVRG